MWNPKLKTTQQCDKNDLIGMEKTFPLKFTTKNLNQNFIYNLVVCDFYKFDFFKCWLR